MSRTNSEKPVRIGRRDIIKWPIMAAAYGIFPHSAAAISGSSGAPMDEADPDGTKIAVKLTVQHTTDEELLFLKQIGLRWLHADFGGEASYDFIRTTQDRFARYGMRVDSGAVGKNCL